MTSLFSTRGAVELTIALFVGAMGGSYVGYIEGANRVGQLDASTRALETLHAVALARGNATPELVSHLESELDTCILELRSGYSFSPLSQIFGFGMPNHAETRRRLRAHREKYASMAEGDIRRAIDDALAQFEETIVK